MIMEKKTKKKLFGEVLAIAAVQESAELKAFVEHEIELLTKKTTNKKMTKAQEENAVTKNLIEGTLGVFETPVTIKQLQENDSELAQFSNQKISSLLKQLIDEGKVVRTEEKRVAYFAIAE